MPDRFVGRLRWLFSGVAVVLVVTGGCALLAAGHGEPAQGGVAAAATSFAFALGVLIVWSPRRYAHLMPVLALASVAAALMLVPASLDETTSDARVVVLGRLLAALVVAAASSLGWLALWLAPQPSDATAARDADLLEALLSAIAPEGEGAAIGARDAPIRARIAEAFASRARGRTPFLRVVLRVLDLRSVVKHRRGFARLDAAQREQLVAGLARSRFVRMRVLHATLTDIVLTRFYGDDRVREQIGDDVGRLAALLEAGPNTAAHRARREAELRADEPEHVVNDEQPEEADQPGLEPALEQAIPRAAPAHRASPSPAPIPEPADDAPFDRAWTLGVPQQQSSATLRESALRVARASGPTRP